MKGFDYIIFDRYDAPVGMVKFESDAVIMCRHKDGYYWKLVSEVYPTACVPDDLN